MTAARLRLVLQLCLAAAAPSDSTAQVIDRDFTRILSLRELSDGRLLVLDAADPQLWSVDPASGASRRVGRWGRGPGEYQSPYRLLAVGLDSTLLVDLESRRWLQLEGDRVTRTYAPDHPAIASTMGLVESADTLGRVVGPYAPASQLGQREVFATDSTEVLLFRLRDGATLRRHRLRARPMVISTTRVGPDGRARAGSTRFSGPLTSEEAATLFADGTLAIVRLDPLRVEYISPSGDVRRGAVLPVPPAPFTTAEYREYVRRNPDASSTPQSSFPATIPQFTQGSRSLSVTPDGLLLIRRTRSVEVQGNHYLVVTPSGDLRGMLRLGENERVALVSARWLYVIVADDDGLERVHRRARSGVIAPL